VARPTGGIFATQKSWCAPNWANDFDMQAFRHLVRRQALLMRLDEDAVVSAIPGLLNNIAPDDIRQVAGMIAQVLGSGDALSAHRAKPS
jgi:hypothetical protein